MANNNNENIVTIILIQKWLSGKLEIGTEFRLKDSERILKLISCEDYPNGKLVFDNGEEFNPGKYPKVTFIHVTKEKEASELDFYDEIDKLLNGKIKIGDNGEEIREALKPGDEEKSIIRKTFAPPQNNKSFHKFTYYDVTSVIEELSESTKGKEAKEKYFMSIYNYFIYNNYPFFTKDQLKDVFYDCKLENTKDASSLKVISKNKVIGYLLFEQGKYIFSPKSKELPREYKYTDNRGTGFYYTAESYLDMALAIIEKYRKDFIPIYNSDSQKNIESFGYQNDATIKTILAFSCECYLKSLLLYQGKDLLEIKTHGLSELFTSLNDNTLSNIFNYMEQKGYNLTNSLYDTVYETNNLTEQFMLDLAKVDEAFIDARYCAEKDKNTNYDFLYRFAIALRDSTLKEYSISTPFTTSIENMVNKKR